MEDEEEEEDSEELNGKNVLKKNRGDIIKGNSFITRSLLAACFFYSK
jgi:hypothetical protein